MTSINFHQSSTDELSQSDNRNAVADKGFFISIGVLVVTLLVWGGFKFFHYRTVHNNEQMNEQIVQLQQSFSKDKVNRMVDLQQRLDVIKENFTTRQDANKMMDAIKNSMLPGVYVDSFSYENKLLEIDFIANDFLSIAKQVLSFKSSGNIDSLVVKDMKRTEKGIIFKISGNFKNK